MQILKIPWFGHKENKKVECYTVTINHDGTRLASGGLDGNIKIWDLSTITPFFDIADQPSKLKKDDPASIKFEESLPDKSLRRPLCTMSRHNGVVTSLKFSPDGRWLASGSDDKICLIWEKDNTQIPKQFGTEEPDLEHWTVRKRLVAHDNDIQDICWSPDGTLLVTVGLDRSVIIWNALTFERIKRYDVHQSMVKGIVFDPANKFFATASDDRTVRIFRYYKKLNEYNNYDFQIEHVVMDPFKKSPLTSYFRRMSWSPDGQHIAVPNATNGPVPSVAIVSRGNWNTDISLIGHEAPVEVCSFSPKLFQKNDNTEENKFQTIVVTGGQDSTLAVWSTCNSRPIVVCSNIVDNAITDICWAPDGETFYFSCLDGSVTGVRFSPGELGNVVNEELIDQELNRYGADRESTILPESVEQLQLEEKSKSNKAISLRRMMPLEEVPRKMEVVSRKLENAIPAPELLIQNKALDLEKLRKQTVTLTKSGKKRVAPILVSSSSAPSNNLTPSTAVAPPLEKKRKVVANSKISQSNYKLPKMGLQTAIQGIKRKEDVNVAAEVEHEDDNDEIGDNITSYSSSVSDVALKRQKNRKKRKIMELKYPSSFKYISSLPEGLFNNLALQNIEINKVYKTHSKNKEIVAELSSGTTLEVDEDLIFSVIFQSFSHVEQANEVLDIEEQEIKTTIEVRNGKPWTEDSNDRDFDDPTKVIVTHNGRDEHEYTLFFPFRIQHVLPIIIDDVLQFYVLCSFTGSIQIISAKSGSYTCPTFELGENIVTLRHSNHHLLVLTSSGLFYSWDLSTMKVNMKGVSIGTIFNDFSFQGKSTITPIVKDLVINPKDGSPIVLLNTNNDVYGYSFDLESWIKLVDSWYYSVGDNSFKLEDNHAINSVINKSLQAYEEDKVSKKLYTYKFTDENNKLKTTMIDRKRELLELI
ncbi:Protein HIR1 [Candida maltosa Xu316]|uniref:Protein HIR n=1 Tax=Candida maltosa (strain Xu316) TaxID=1245528 RepID=M3HU41_CANMX|nr:Protein HIR1 [Candida maltosa Xu316]